MNAAIVKDTVIEPSRYSKWSKLLQITASYVLLFIIKTCALAKIKDNSQLPKNEKAEKVTLSAEDLINSKYSDIKESSGGHIP